MLLSMASTMPWNINIDRHVAWIIIAAPSWSLVGVVRPFNNTVPGTGGVRGPSALAGACGGDQLVMWW